MMIVEVQDGMIYVVGFGNIVLSGKEYNKSKEKHSV